MTDSFQMVLQCFEQASYPFMAYVGFLLLASCVVRSSASVPFFQSTTPEAATLSRCMLQVNLANPISVDLRSIS